jgi:hypothetical protein
LKYIFDHAEIAIAVKELDEGKEKSLRVESNHLSPKICFLVDCCCPTQQLGNPGTLALGAALRLNFKKTLNAITHAFPHPTPR